MGDAEDAEMRVSFREGVSCEKNSCARHKWFRTFDKRRYSMFYHRYKSYLLALEYAKSQNFEYDWFVMARPDVAWGAPIDSIEKFPDDRVYVTDRWGDIVPGNRPH